MFIATLFARPISKSFLKSPGRELSEYMVLSSGKSFLASLDFREVCQVPKNTDFWNFCGEMSWKADFGYYIIYHIVTKILFFIRFLSSYKYLVSRTFFQFFP